MSAFFDTVIASGTSSFKYLQNVYTVKNVGEQGLSLALCLTDGLATGAVGASRVHGGGFAGTIQAYVKSEHVDEYVRLMSAVFGEGAVMRLNVRPLGAIKVF
jgi:galactokinase